jgi:uncharacterized protein
MASTTMLILGAFRFKISTAAYDTLTTSQSYRWVKQARIRQFPAQQFLGNDLRTISLKGTIFPSFRGGLGQIDKMRLMASLGIPLPLIDGIGRIYGLFVIKTIGEVQTMFLADGRPRRIDFTLELEAYGEDSFFFDVARVAIAALR